MTWNGVQGFKSAPNSTLSLNGAKAGTWHSERNLTFVAVDSARPPRLHRGSQTLNQITLTDAGHMCVHVNICF